MRVLVYSANRLFGECLERGLSRQHGIAWSGFAADVPQAVELAGDRAETVVLIDCTIAEVAGVIEALRARLRVSSVLALAVDQRDGESLLKCARLGCQGVVSVDTPLEAVPGIIRAAGRGEVELTPRAAADMFRVLSDDRILASEPAGKGLTRREREVCRLVCDGLSNKEIALELNRSVGTVKNHIHAILSKLDVPRRSAIPRQYFG